MNILIINYEYPPIGAGAARQNHYMAHELVNQGHDVMVLTAAYQDLKGISNENGVRIWRLPSRRKKKNQSNLLEMLSYVFWALIYLKKAIRENKTDKIIVFFSFPCGPIGLWAKFRFKIPYLIYLQGSDIPGNDPKMNTLHKVLSPLRRLIYKNSNSVVANSPGAAQMASKADNNFPIKYIPNGIDTHFYKPLAINKEKLFTYLFIGRLHHEKNIFLLLNAFEKYYAENAQIQLKIIGQGYQEQEIKDFITSHQAEKRIKLLAWQEKQKLPTIYNTAHCFINPSLNEGMPNAVMEAMACALPSIVSNVPGNRDLITHQQNGLLFESENEQQLMECLRTMANNSQLREQLGVNARKLMVEKYAVEAMTRQFYSILIR